MKTQCSGRTALTWDAEAMRLKRGQIRGRYVTAVCRGCYSGRLQTHLCGGGDGLVVNLPKKSWPPGCQFGAKRRPALQSYNRPHQTR